MSYYVHIFNQHKLCLLIIYIDIIYFQNFGDASFYAVYDGHNGLDAAVYSSMYLHQFLVQSDHYPTNPELALYESFFATDKGFTTKTEKYVSILLIVSKNVID